MESIDILTGDLQVRTATYGPEIDQSGYAKSVSHIITVSISVVTVCCPYHIQLPPSLFLFNF